MPGNIVKGYKGVMDLELELVPKEYRKEAIEQHERDIKEYTMEQQQLPERLRYENTVMKAIKLHEADNVAAQKRKEIKIEEQEKRMNIIKNSRKPETPRA
tara:strand:+ start:624 stop:923 length:300 start_codon:yes stop_codon:yes gene_type:complete